MSGIVDSSSPDVKFSDLTGITDSSKVALSCSQVNVEVKMYDNEVVFVMIIINVQVCWCQWTNVHVRKQSLSKYSQSSTCNL